MIATLTEYESHLVSDGGVLIAKNKIIQQVQNFFGLLAEKYKEQLNNTTGSCTFTNAKISKGENYLGLPYVMLDYPREFKKPDILAIRSFFWWGNFFSITLHLSGSYLQLYGAAIQKAIYYEKLQQWYICVSNKQWEHHFEPDNYKAIENRQYDFASLPFLKLAKKIPLDKWDNATTFFTENFALIIEILQTHAPMR